MNCPYCTDQVQMAKNYPWYEIDKAPTHEQHLKQIEVSQSTFLKTPQPIFKVTSKSHIAHFRDKLLNSLKKLISKKSDNVLPYSRSHTFTVSENLSQGKEPVASNYDETNLSTRRLI